MRDPYPQSSYESDVGAIKENEFLSVHPGWNVWRVWQVKDLPFSVMMMGVDRDRQLRIWVEDAVRLGAPGSLVADSIDLKGGQVQILNGAPVGLKTEQRKEQVPGPAMIVDGPAELRTVRFFNRGDSATMAWPHDESYLLEQTFVPVANNPATSGPAPDTITGGVVKGATEPVKDLLSGIPASVYVVGVIGVGLYLLRKDIFESGKRTVRQFRASRRRRAEG